MKFLSQIRLLLLSIWLGSSVFFIGVAQSAFAVLEARDLAGAVVNRNLMILNIGGLAIAVLLLVTSFIGSARIATFSAWFERFLLVVIAAACAVGQFVISFWMASIRSQISGPIEQAAADDPLKLQFDLLHQWSVRVLMIGMAAALIAFFVIAARKFIEPKQTAEIYDFKKEFKI